MTFYIRLLNSLNTMHADKLLNTQFRNNFGKLVIFYHKKLPLFPSN